MASALIPKWALGRPVSLSLGAIVVLAAVNMLLVGAGILVRRQNVTLHGAITHCQALLTPAPGNVVHGLLGKDLTGVVQSVTFGEDPRPTLFYSFTRGCPFCQDNWRAMRTLQSLAPKSLRIVYIDTAPDTFTPEYLTESGIGESLVLVKLIPPVDSAYDPRAVPQLLLVDSQARIQWAHMGEVSSSEVSGVVALVKRY